MKKQFRRTVPGKVLIFIGCLICWAGLVTAAVIAVDCYEKGAYSMTEEEAFKEQIQQLPQVRTIIMETADKMDRGQTNEALPQYSVWNLQYRIISPGGSSVFSSSFFSETGSWGGLKGVILRDPETANLILRWDDTAKSDYMASYVRYHVSVGFLKDFPIEDGYRTIKENLEEAYRWRIPAAAAILPLLAVGITLFILLMNVSARRSGSEELFPGPLNRVPFDVLTLLTAGGLILLYDVLRPDRYSSFSLEWIGVAALLGPAAFSLFLGLCMSAAARIKQKNLLSGLLVTKILRLIGCFLKGIWDTALRIPVVWKTALVCAVWIVLDLWMIVALERNRNTTVFFLLFLKLLFVVLAIHAAFQMKQLKKAGEALAGGDLSAHTDTKGMLWEFKAHGEDLNRIGEGMNRAVEARLKSERMKTELISNVSHDIRTPLTSIINYTDLIAQEPCENPKIWEYTEVLTRQSGQLKRLVEDLIEASKATAGAVEIKAEPCDARTLLSQAAGEYEERMGRAGLTPVVQLPEQPITVCVDGRQTWRIFDNLLGNICKYALPGTRVYLSLEKKGERAVFTFRNTSREALGVSADELMERFVRGDSSRHTEGSGLGLSIARSLAELQGGTLTLTVDGDLFKVLLSFPTVASSIKESTGSLLEGSLLPSP